MTLKNLLPFIELPLIAALIGWLTNWVAIKMLFHPKKRIKIGIFEIQGIFPKRQKIFAEKLGMVVAHELFSSHDIKEKINQSNIDKEIKALIDKHINTFLNTKLKEAYPQIVMFIYNYIIRQFKDVTMKEIETLLPLVLNAYKQNIEKSLDIVDIEGTVASKVANFSSDKLEEILYSIMKKEFRFVEILGGVLGFIIGLLQVILVNL
jgi:uncharacterized membrane protein YheB (UPF0754 family)